MSQVHFSDVADHFVDSHHGIYSGQVFAQRLDSEFINGQIAGIDAESWAILIDGPDNEDYIDVWAELDNVTITDTKGKEWAVYEYEGIFLYPKDADIDWDEMNS